MKGAALPTSTQDRNETIERLAAALGEMPPLELAGSLEAITFGNHHTKLRELKEPDLFELLDEEQRKRIGSKSRHQQAQAISRVHIDILNAVASLYDVPPIAGDASWEDRKRFYKQLRGLLRHADSATVKPQTESQGVAARNRKKSKDGDKRGRGPSRTARRRGTKSHGHH